MKTIAFAVLTLSAAALSTPSRADSYIVTRPEPVTTYTVCDHPAQFVVNDRARRLRAGGSSLVIAGSTATVTETPGVYLQTEHLVRHSYQSLSANGACYN